MDYAREPLADRLAAEYVLGTLRGSARRRFEALLPAHPQLKQAVAQWERRLGPLALQVPPAEPRAVVWQRIEARVFGPAEPAARWWQRLGWWQSVAGAASALALALAVFLVVPRPQQPPLVIVMSSSGGAQEFVASLSGDGSSLVLKPLGPVQVGPSQALELWQVPAKGAPRSLGLVQVQGPTVRHVQLGPDAAALAVSLEPSGGSPTGLPTGPILAVGKLKT
jgi:anti-sigma-K factor RskA